MKDLLFQGENGFKNDVLVTGGIRSGRFNNGTMAREEREYKTDHHLVQYMYITRVYDKYVEKICNRLISGRFEPDVVILNSCLWDLTRYGNDESVFEWYKYNLHRLINHLDKLPKKTLIIWNTTLPLAKDIKGGFLIPECKDLCKTLRFDILEANYCSAQIFDAYGFDVVDMNFVMRNKMNTCRQGDGIHWDNRGHRMMTNMLLSHIAKAWNKELSITPIERLLENSDLVDDVTDHSPPLRDANSQSRCNASPKRVRDNSKQSNPDDRDGNKYNHKDSKRMKSHHQKTTRLDRNQTMDLAIPTPMNNSPIQSPGLLGPPPPVCFTNNAVLPVIGSATLLMSQQLNFNHSNNNYFGGGYDNRMYINRNWNYRYHPYNY